MSRRNPREHARAEKRHRLEHARTLFGEFREARTPYLFNWVGDIPFAFRYRSRRSPGASFRWKRGPKRFAASLRRRRRGAPT